MHTSVLAHLYTVYITNVNRGDGAPTCCSGENAHGSAPPPPLPTLYTSTYLNLPLKHSSHIQSPQKIQKMVYNLLLIEVLSLIIFIPGPDPLASTHLNSPQPTPQALLGEDPLIFKALQKSKKMMYSLLDLDRLSLIILILDHLDPWSRSSVTILKTRRAT